MGEEEVAAGDGAEEVSGGLPEDERTRRLILHFALPRTITTCDPAEQRSTDAELNHVLAAMAWGTLDAETAGWVIVSDEPTLDSPDSSLISYAEFIRSRFPTHSGVDEGERADNKKQATEKLSSFTSSGEPGEKFKPMYDQMVKCLAYSNKALVKAFNVGKVCLDEAELPEDPNAEDALNIVRFGRYQILPAFWKLLVHLTKEKRWFSVVFRTFGDEIPMVQREYRNFCQGSHPCYNGTNKTARVPLMNGEKGSRDMRLTDEYVGRLDRISSRLEFMKRSADKGSRKKEEEKKADAGPTEGIGGDVAVPTHMPTVYEYPPYHAAYAGLLHHILDESNAAAIVDDKDFWEAKEQAPTAGKLLLVDDAKGPAETKVQNIFFDGHIQADNAHCVDVRDVVSGEPVPLATARDVYAHRVDFYQAIVDPEYFIKALATCEAKMSERIIESKKVKVTSEGFLDPSILKELPPKEYLYRTVIPALLPALEACQRDRPKDPISYIAFYMLRHPHGFSKSLVA